MNSIEVPPDLSYDQLVSFDRISVVKITEKKGTIIKHVEYNVQSQVSSGVIILI